MDKVLELNQKLFQLYRLKAQGANLTMVIADAEQELRQAVEERIDERNRQEEKEKEAHLRGH
jgi:hypothetical protein